MVDDDKAASSRGIKYWILAFAVAGVLTLAGGVYVALKIARSIDEGPRQAASVEHARDAADAHAVEKVVGQAYPSREVTAWHTEEPGQRVWIVTLAGDESLPADAESRDEWARQVARMTVDSLVFPEKCHGVAIRFDHDSVNDGVPTAVGLEESGEGSFRFYYADGELSPTAEFDFPGI